MYGSGVLFLRVASLVIRSTRRLLDGVARFRAPDSRVDSRTGEEAIYRGLAKRVEQLQAEQERRMRAAAAADEEFSAEFLTMARAVFDMIDKDQSGTLTKKEIVDAVRGPRPSRRCLRLSPARGRGNIAATGSPGSAVTHCSTKHRSQMTRK